MKPAFPKIMKRLKLKQNKFLALYQTFTDSGQPISFEIVRPSNNPVPMIKTFNANQEAAARDAFHRLFLLITIKGPQLSRRLITKIVTGRGLHGDLLRSKRKKYLRSKCNAPK
jgi:hypothetical protein